MSSNTTTPTWRLQDRLARSLDYAGIEVAEMANALHRSRNTIGNYLAGRTTPDTATLYFWAARCGVDLQWLTEGEDTGTVTHEYLPNCVVQIPEPIAA